MTTVTLRVDLSNNGIEALFPGTAAYISATSRNKRLTVYPEAITFPTSPEQVAKIVEIAGKHKRRVVPLSGGHSSISNGIGGTNGALIIDLCKLKGIIYNDQTHQMIFQTGNRLMDVVDALAEKKRAFAHGICPTVGIGGHPAFGGYGFATRLWGLNCDAIVSMDVVKDDGSLKLNVDSNTDTDLFWAMRGAAPSFAIATALTYKTYPAPEIAMDYKFINLMTPQEAAAAIFAFQEFANDTNADLVPKELGLQFRVDRGPLLLPEYDARIALTVRGTYYGLEATYYDIIEPFLKRILGTTDTKTKYIYDTENKGLPFPPADPTTFFSEHYAVVIIGDYYSSFTRGAVDVTLTGDSVEFAKSTELDSILHKGQANVTVEEDNTSYIKRVISPKSRATLQNEEETQDLPEPLASFYLKTLMAPTLNQPALEAFMKCAAENGQNSLDWYVAFKLLGGRSSFFPDAAETAFGWRSSFWFIELNADSRTAPLFPDIGYTFLDNLVDSIKSNMPDATFGAYPGFLDDRLQNFNEAYYGDNLQRLQEIRTASMRSVFDFPQSI